MAEINENEHIYKQQQQVGLLSFLAELPNFVAILVSAIMSRSLVMWLDLVDSFSNVARSSSIFISSRALKGSGVSDPEKLEFQVAAFCNINVMIGLTVLLVTSFTQLFNPAKPEVFLIVAVGIKVINVAVDIYMLHRQKKILSLGETAIVRAEYNGLFKDCIFDSATFLVVLVCYLLIDYRWSWYISPAICTVMSFLFLLKYTYDTVVLFRKRKH